MCDAASTTDVASTPNPNNILQQQIAQVLHGHAAALRLCAADLQRIVLKAIEDQLDANAAAAEAIADTYLNVKWSQGHSGENFDPLFPTVSRQSREVPAIRWVQSYINRYTKKRHFSHFRKGRGTGYNMVQLCNVAPAEMFPALRASESAFAVIRQSSRELSKLRRSFDAQFNRIVRDATKAIPHEVLQNNSQESDGKTL